jgi:EmrB/QacA subfamily drug resistance transporter
VDGQRIQSQHCRADDPAAGLGGWIGRKRTFLIGLVVFALASVACALSPKRGLLIPARILQGAGGAMILPAALALLTASTPAHKRGAIMGAYAAVMGLAVVGGPLVGGVVTQRIAWQRIFWINVPVIAVVLPHAYIKLGEAKGLQVRFDVVGVVLAAAFMFGVVWALVRSGPAGWGSGEVLGTLIGGLVLLVCFVGWQLRTRQPMIPMGLFRVREFTASNLAALMLTASLMSTVFFLAQYFQIALGYSPLGAGLRFLPFTLPVLFVPPLAGRLQDKIGPRWLISAGMTVQGVGMLWVASNALSTTDTPQWSWRSS